VASSGGVALRWVLSGGLSLLLHHSHDNLDLQSLLPFLLLCILLQRGHNSAFISCLLLLLGWYCLLWLLTLLCLFRLFRLFKKGLHPLLIIVEDALDIVQINCTDGRVYE